MAKIVAGRFMTFEDAEGGARRLYRRSVGPDDVSIFFMNPSGQHARYPIGGDVYADSAAKPAGKGAIVGTVRGVIIGGIVGLIVYALAWRYWYIPVTAALAGAYIGAFGGAVGRMKGRAAEGAGTLPKTDSGVILAVHVSEDESSARAVEAEMRAVGAQSIERVDGDWQDGQWRDFDPTRRPDEAPHPKS